MKKPIILILAMLVSFISYGQLQKNLNEVTVSPPKFTGIPVQKVLTYETIEGYLTKTIQDQIQTNDISEEGTVVVQFTVTPLGEVSDITVINSVSPFLDNQVTEALQNTNGMWKPGTNNDLLVSMEKEVAISFRNKDNQKFVPRAQWFFKKGSKLLYKKEKPKRALKYYNYGVNLLPNSRPLLAARGLAKYELGDQLGACNDWNRVKNLGGIESEGYMDNFCELPGYAEMINILNSEE